MNRFLSLILFLFQTIIANSQSLDSECIDGGIIINSMPNCNNTEYYILFEDNFDTDTLDLSKWSINAYGVGQQYGLSASQEFYSLDNMDISNGTCKLIAKKESVMGKAISWKPDDEILEDGLPNYRKYNYTSSRLSAKEDICLYGKYEIRCRLPNGKGFWPSFWIFSGSPWNELDFFDNMEGTSRYSCGPGYDYDGDGNSSGCRWGTYNIPDLSQWHTYTVIYDYDRIIWQIDNETIRTLYRFHTLTGLPVLCGDNIAKGLYFQKMSFPVKPMHLIIELAIRNGEEAPDKNTVFPSSYEIDYVRYWVKAGQNKFLNTFINNKVDIYPNPANKNFTISFSLNYQTSISYSIFNMYGKEILYDNNIPGTPGINNIYTNVNSLPNGIYLLKLVANNEFITNRFIVSK